MKISPWKWKIFQPWRWWIFKPVRLIFRFIGDVIVYVRKKVNKNIRLELMVTFGICLLAFLSVTSLTGSWYSRYNRIATIDYSRGIDQIDADARYLADLFHQSNNEDQEKYQRIQDNLNNISKQDRLRILIVDLDGKVLAKSPNATETLVDVYSVINNVMNYRIEIGMGHRYTPEEFSSFYPVSFKGTKGYVIVSGVPEGNIIYTSSGDSFMSVINGLAAFVILFYLMTRGKMRYIEELAQGLLEISKGNLNYRVQQKSEDELGSLAGNINHMAKELQHKIEEERKAEKTKNELITNVSHDLRTPLTSIMGYLRLLKDKRYDNPAQLEEYVNISYGKAEKLKSLIEDLFEYTKLTGDTIKLNRQVVSLDEMLEQLMDELVPVCEENDLTLVKTFPPEKVMVHVDVDKTVRVFENLLMNAIKYSDKPGTIQIRLLKAGNKVTVTIENKGEPIPQEDLHNLFERFFRVEKSRSEATGGSGLGLAIAKNIIDLHEGEIWAECEENWIRFSVRLEMAEGQGA